MDPSFFSHTRYKELTWIALNTLSLSTFPEQCIQAAAEEKYKFASIQ